MTELRVKEDEDHPDAPFHEELEQVVVDYMPLVRHLVNRIVVGPMISTILEYEDLLSYGVQGLIEAYHAYDAARGAKFSTYALPRIRGAILDALRAAHPLPRSLQTASTMIERSRNELYTDLGRAPTRPELAARLGVTDSQLMQTSKILNIKVLSLDAVEERLVSGASEHLIELADDDPNIEPEAIMQREVTRGHLMWAVAQLPEREREIVSLYYFHSRSLKSIGMRLGISESRTSQLRNRAVRRLRVPLEVHLVDAA